MKKSKMEKFRISWDGWTKTWVLSRTDLQGDYHAHYKDKQMCYKLVNLYHKGLKPNTEYHHEAMRRITTQEEWDSFTQKRQKPKFKKKQKHMLSRRGE